MRWTCVHLRPSSIVGDYPFLQICHAGRKDAVVPSADTVRRDTIIIYRHAERIVIEMFAVR